jgi:hypothetical protein
VEPDEIGPDADPAAGGVAELSVPDCGEREFSFDPDDPAAPTSSGHFVVQHRENVNYAQLHDRRVTDTQHTTVHLADGTNLPIQIRTTVLFSADGGVEVKVDSATCGGQGGA